MGSPEFTHVEIHPLLCEESQEQVVPLNREKNVEHSKFHEFSGSRIKRGLYKTKDNLILNADINGSINILRKYLKESKLNDLKSDNVRAFVNTPVRKLSVFSKPIGL